MTLEDLIAQFRADAFDEEAPYAFSDVSVTGWINEAEVEATLRRDLLHESEDADLCEIAVTAGEPRYDLHAKWARITDVFWEPDGGTAADRIRMVPIKRSELDRIKPNWRTDEEDPPRYVIVEDKRLRLGCLPGAAGTLYLEGYRMPLEDMSEDADVPEIGDAHHRHLVAWALHKAYSRPDTEIENPQRAASALADFEAHFGPRVNADMLRDTESTPTFVKAW